MAARADVAHDALADMKVWVAALEAEQDEAKESALGIDHPEASTRGGAA